ncbi:hypothetical protein ACWGID_20820 [Kribbella sp. NPDC054772]
MGRFRRLGLGLTAGVVLVIAGMSPAAAHPFGDPQTVSITADGTDRAVVHVRWKVGGLDDLTLLGVALGVLPQDRVLMDGAVMYQPADSAAIGPSPKFTGYLLRRITVASRGKDCPGSVTSAADVAKAGVSIDYTCPAAVGEIALTVTTLTDLNPAYKTLATGPNGARAMYGDGNERHDWTVGSVEDTHLGRSAAIQVGAIALAVLVLAVGGVFGVRRWRRA